MHMHFLRSLCVIFHRKCIDLVTLKGIVLHKRWNWGTNIHQIFGEGAGIWVRNPAPNIWKHFQVPVTLLVVMEITFLIDWLISVATGDDQSQGDQNGSTGCQNECIRCM